MEDKQRREQATGIAPKRESKKEPKKRSERKPITAETLLKFYTRPYFWVITLFIVVWVLLSNFDKSFDYTKQEIGDGAYKYSEDSYTYLMKSLFNYLGDDGPDIVTLREDVPTFTISHENGIDTLFLAMQDGFFNPTLTTYVNDKNHLEGVDEADEEALRQSLFEDPDDEGAKGNSQALNTDDEDTETASQPQSNDADGTETDIQTQDTDAESTTNMQNPVRNFNSLDEYQDYFWATFKRSTFERTCGKSSLWVAYWVVPNLLAFAILAIIVYSKNKKAEKAKGATIQKGEAPVEKAEGAVTQKEEASAS